MRSIANIEVTTEHIVVDGQELVVNGQGLDMLYDAYRRYVNDYPKFFKMDGLCKLGVLASELLLKTLDEERFIPRDDRAIVLFNRHGSHEADQHYLSTISDPDNYFPSPSVFVYTLPNIVTGEIAIRNHYLGETSFYVLNDNDTAAMQRLVAATFSDPATQSVLTGWVDFTDSSHFEANLEIILR